MAINYPAILMIYKKSSPLNQTTNFSYSHIDTISSNFDIFIQDQYRLSTASMESIQVQFRIHITNMGSIRGQYGSTYTTLV